METSIIQNFGQQVHDIKANRETTGPLGQEVSAAAHARNAERKGIVTESEQVLNGGVIDNNINLSLEDGENTLAFVFKAAVQNINEALEPSLGPNAIQATFDSGAEPTPESTASSIASAATSLFGGFQDSNPELSPEEALSEFTAILRSGIEQGFNEARTVLDNLNGLTEDVSAKIDSTQEKLQALIDEFEASTDTTSNPEPPEDPEQITDQLT